MFNVHSNPLFIELCSGCGILSASVKACGFNILPVDCKRNKHKPRVRTFCLDLSESHSWTVLRYIVKSCKVVAVHLAPPCGACSRAREIRMSSEQHGPPPLRDLTHPYGVPKMSQRERVRVDAANKIYREMAAFCEFLDTLGVAWTLENPTNSWLWQLPCFKF